MRLTYKCPHCQSAINAKKNIILTAHGPGSRDNRGLALLHEEIGNYTVAMSATLEVNTGDVVDFFCPVCNENLVSDKNKEMAHFIRVDEIGEETTIYISRTYGERCTFQVDDKKQMRSYGDSVKKFLDPEWFK